ncbi:MAG: hypothetical protein V8R85_03055 [Frisingicoccus sp.]
MKKKFLAITLCVVMALRLVACGGGNDSGTTETTGTEAADGESTNEGSNTVVVAMGSGFSTLDPGYVYEKYPPLIVNACYETLFKFYSNDRRSGTMSGRYLRVL